MREQEILQRFGTRVRALRKERRWSQETLAEHSGLHENYISRLETGTQEPGLIVINKIARAFNVTPGTLLD